MAKKCCTAKRQCAIQPQSVICSPPVLGNAELSHNKTQPHRTHWLQSERSDSRYAAQTSIVRPAGGVIRSTSLKSYLKNNFSFSMAMIRATKKSLFLSFFQGASDWRQEFSVLHSAAVWELHLLHLTTAPCTVSTTPRTSIFYFVITVITAF